MAAQARAGRTNTVILFLSAYLILRLLWRLFTPGGSWAMPPWHLIEMVIDAMLLACVFFLRPQAVAAIAPDDPGRGWKHGLIWGGIVAGIGAIAIRFTGNVGWWTGHLN